MKTIAVILSGCGVFDGSEIHEAVLTMLAISKQGAEYQIYAPNIDQHHVVNHFTKSVESGTRNVLAEAARIARGNIQDLKELNVDQVDALMIPGGFGAAKNFSDFAFKGADCEVLPDFAKVIRSAVALGKPIGALCIAPAIVARILEDVLVTVGEAEGAGEAVQKMGATHQVATHCEIVVDIRYKLVTSPCYMLEASIAQIEEGAANTVRKVLELCD